MSPKSLSQQLTEHPHYAYRACAPDVDEPSRAAGDLSVPVTAWEEPDLDGGESQRVRAAREAAAKRLCGGCPVLAACRAAANALTEDGKLVEPFFVRGGQTALERHKALIAKRHQIVEPAPTPHLLTEQKQKVLAALAAHRSPYEVADAAGMDVRTANWQRAKLVSMLGLPRGASRMDLLHAARERGVLPELRHEVVVDDGSVPAIPSVRRPRPAKPVPARKASARHLTAVPPLPGRPVNGRAATQLSLFPIDSRTSDALEAAA